MEVGVVSPFLEVGVDVGHCYCVRLCFEVILDGVDF